MKNILLIPNPSKDIGLKMTDRVVEKLKSLGIRTIVQEKPLISTATHSDVDLIIVIGGDGSVIDASVYAVELGVPLLGINLGKVGYLSELEPPDISLLDRLVTGEYSIEEKMLLSVECNHNDGVERSSRLALNDIVISHGDYLGISDIVVENGRGDAVKYRCDGIIAATPAGSTAYSLSAGGPIVDHSLNSIIVTPVCPHTFFNRSIIYGENEKIKIINEGSSELKVSIDGRLFSELLGGECCTVSKSAVGLSMLTFSENNMFETLFKKMKLLEELA